VEQQRLSLWANIAPGCRRIIIDPDYLACLHRPNVTLRWDGVDSLVEEGIKVKTGEIIPLDIVIFATGYSRVRLQLVYHVRGMLILVVGSREFKSARKAGRQAFGVLRTQTRSDCVPWLVLSGVPEHVYLLRWAGMGFSLEISKHSPKPYRTQRLRWPLFNYLLRRGTGEF